ncbi:hypothetical protein E2C01_051124 [Portunus trituberculatus]|uniref:Uncharacterized protein n=1 Tax=Portunus trituberculatus TaxID=210409 RepID=A0A5B7GA61_PORTR|nr:hypothetical protein [Portunus trituberculatus]
MVPLARHNEAAGMSVSIVSCVP